MKIFQNPQLWKECEVVLRAGKDMSIFLLVRLIEPLIFANRYSEGFCWMMKLDYFQTTAKTLKIGKKSDKW